MSWLTPILREIDGDISATAHKDALFSKGATPNMIVKADQTVTREVFDATVKLFREGHEGAENAYKTLFMMGGFDPVVVGSNLRSWTSRTPKVRERHGSPPQRAFPR